MAYHRITLDKRQHVAHITLAGLDVGNAVDLQMATELREACQEVQDDDQVRVAVLQAKGGVFCRGSSLSVPSPDGATVDDLRQALQSHRVASALASITKPVIAALQGDALDQGLEMALACDVRIAAVGIRLGFPGAPQGLLPWDGGSQRLLRVAGISRAMDLLLTGRLIDTDEAHAVGLVNMIVNPQDLGDRADQMALTIARSAPVAARYAKETVRRGLDMPLQEGMRMEADQYLLLFTTADRTEGISSFLERRQATYRGE